MRRHSVCVVNAARTACWSSPACSAVRIVCPAPSGAQRCVATRLPAGETTLKTGRLTALSFHDLWPLRIGSLADAGEVGEQQTGGFDRIVAGLHCDDEGEVGLNECCEF